MSAALPHVADSFNAVHATLDDVERRARAMRPVLAFSPLPGLREVWTRKFQDCRDKALEMRMEPRPDWNTVIQLEAAADTYRAVLLDLDRAEDRT